MQIITQFGLSQLAIITAVVGTAATSSSKMLYVLCTTLAFSLEKPANIAIGGKEHDILFMAARTSVYTLKLKVKNWDQIE